MASWMVHLRVADLLLEKWDGLEKTEFIVGNIAPDSGVPNEDWSQFSPNTTISHFKVLDENGQKRVCIEKYVQKHFTEKQQLEYSEKQYSFYLGYYVHLLTDILWTKNIVETSILADKIAYEADPVQTVWKWKEDWYDLDFQYIRDNPEFRAFQIYEQAEGFRNEYLNIFSEDAFDNRRKYITEFYHEKRENLDREYHYLTKTQMDEFVENAFAFMLGNIKVREIIEE